MQRQNDDYQERVNRVLDHVSRHLDQDLSLAHLARIACFSPYHFHRIFQSVTGETLNGHVRRVRLERAVLLMKASPRRRITDVALEVGFAGAAEFSRAFKHHFDRTASSWDRRSPLENSKIGKDPQAQAFYSEEELERWQAASQARVRTVNLGAFRYVYKRIFAPYGKSRLVESYHALIAWLRQRGTEVHDVVVIGMSLDDPSVTPAEKCRYDLGAAFRSQPGGMLGEIVRTRGRRGIVAPPERSECGRAGLSIRDFGSQQVAAVHCTGDLGDVDRAWHYLYRIWLPAASFDPADLPAMSIFVRLPEEIGWQTFDLHACLPVVRR